MGNLELISSQYQATIDSNVINVIEHNLAKLNERKRWQVEHLDGQRSSRSAVVPIKTGKASRESQKIWQFFQFKEKR